MDTLFRIDVLLIVGMAAAAVAILAGLRGACGVTINSRIDRENQNTFAGPPPKPTAGGPRPTRPDQRRRAA